MDAALGSGKSELGEIQAGLQQPHHLMLQGITQTSLLQADTPLQRGW